MAELDGPRWGPANKGRVRQIVFLLHGVGADGNDLIDLAPQWGLAVPDALFVAPHAPFPYAGAPYGRQWFDLEDRTPARMEAGVRAVAPMLDALIAGECAAAGLPETHIMLMGFSQGAMTALFLGLRRATPPAAILAYSGLLLAPESLGAELRGRPPVLLVHGEADEVVPVAGSRAAERVLRDAGVPVESTYSPRLAHGIDDAGLSAGALLLQRAAAGLAGG
ncbi:phospholipase [Pararoseomonas sp. SCSIO 73927]|uniref:alpha/beta hydrolase n=1 Tax=Pararoseomonas sp. SCSIO 73927 TaxID=3114537 RepID=UPI0030CDD44E